MHEIFTLLAGDWRVWIPQPAANAVLTVMAALCGIIIGLEREKRDKPTGIRTLALVSLGSAIFTMLSELVGGAGETRMMAQIISGIGFLGAGAIMHRRFSVAGLTSAAAIWITAAIGMVTGAGHAGVGLALALFVLVLLCATHLIESFFLGRCQFTEVRLACIDDNGKTLIRIEETLEEFPYASLAMDTHPDIGGRKAFEISVQYCSHHKLHKELLPRLAEIPGVAEVNRPHLQVREKGTGAVHQN